ncbi:MAG: CbtB domain-containing protein [Alphaproteobacteria bacterium]|jgi:cobalt transporter subunit CbtB|nr:CbtB domain-containing protein [Alphaproteobacteria bacterium]MDP6238819.1 CbtB domain-containing protein [Alphaproteobacteria bacterium]MDP7172123.1 CbtB domain-containing protein [Alphaproteobacteria bacterium]MDP7232564.1 CbtB domain-containing protein [Alphaproteobacteria bacterium]MDP7488596.1 CbtB domain-containing protein [Alphaproteobacteria bacterium]
MTAIGACVESGPQAARGLGTLAAVVAAALLGVFILYGAGFAQPSLLHNAAHDGRHGMAFPCH